MKLHQIEHIIRAAASITNSSPILVIGSQSILGRYPNPPVPLGESKEADVWPINAPDKVEAINGAIGEITIFQDTFGYYAHGLSPDVCPLPNGWNERLITRTSENMPGCVALFLHPDDLACSKLAAGRPKDVDFVATMLAYGYVTVERLDELRAQLPRPEYRQCAEQNLPIVIHKAQEIAKSKGVEKSKSQPPDLEV